jgi:hypothetical protein
MLFRSHYCSLWKGKKHPQRNLNTAAGQQWKALPSERRAMWEALAKEKEEEHKILYPDYKYSPQSRNAKVSAAMSSSSTTAEARHGGSASLPTLPLAHESEIPNEASLQVRDPPPELDLRTNKS